MHVDLFGPLKTSTAGNKYIMVMTDAFTKYAEVASLTDKSALSVARAFLERWICRFSSPCMMVTDQGKEFCNKVLNHVCRLWDIDKHRTSPFHPQSNSSAESYNRSLIRYMRAVIADNLTLDWEELLPMMSLAYNCHVHRSTGETPFFLTFLHDPRLPVFDVAKPRQFYNHGFVEDSYVTMREAFARATMSMEETQAKAKTYYDKKAKERHFNVGDRVLVHFPNVPPGHNARFYTKWRPFIVTKKVGTLNLECQEEGGKARPILVHVDRVVLLQDKLPEDADEVAAVTRQADQGDWVAMEILERLERARQEEEERWEEDDEPAEFEPVSRSRSDEPQPVELSPPSGLEDGDARLYDPWFSLGSLLFGRAHTRSQGPVEEVPLPPSCPARRPRGPSTSHSSQHGSAAPPNMSNLRGQFD